MPFNETEIKRDPVGKFASHEGAGLSGELLDVADAPVRLEKIDNDTVVVPAGRYFLGDPCYPVSHDSWDHAGESVDDGWGSGEPIRTLPSGDQFVTLSTAYGDGVYEGSNGAAYAVDSGTLGLVPERAWDREPEEGRRTLDELGTFVTFNDPTTIRRDGSKIIAGTITIDTDPCVSCGGPLDRYKQCPTCSFATCEGCSNEVSEADLIDGRCSDCGDEDDEDEE